MIEYTASPVSTPLSQRVWTPVTGLANGFQGTELWQASAVNANGTVNADNHDSARNGWASLTFTAVSATGIRIGFSNVTTLAQNHYRVYEYEAYGGGGGSSSTQPGGGNTISAAALQGWQFSQCDGIFGVLMNIAPSGDTTFEGALENGNGLIQNGRVSGSLVTFTRFIYAAQEQYLTGQIVNEGGRLKMSGTWTGYFQERCAPGRNNWLAVKQ